MIFTSLNGDISINYEIKSIDDTLFKWNIKNNFICTEYIKNNYFLNYYYFKIIINYDTKKIQLLNNIDIFIIDNIKKNIKDDEIINIIDYINEIDKYIISLDTSNITQENIDLYNSFFQYYKNEYSLIFVIDNINIINKLYDNTLQINKLENISIYNDDEYNIFYLEIDSIKKNNKLNKLINNGKLESINITLIILPSLFPQVKFIIDFENIILKNDISNIFSTCLTLFDYVNKLLEYINDEKIINTINNNIINNTHNIIKQIINLNIISDNKDLIKISEYINNLSIIHNA
tara:strand:- start:10267 stop:11139 length:873 start_codon:yes stop_codon:yes gene_type:complete